MGPTIYSVLVLRRISDMTKIFLSREAAIEASLGSVRDGFEEARQNAKLLCVMVQGRSSFRDRIETSLGRVRSQLLDLSSDASPRVVAASDRLSGVLDRFHEDSLADVEDPSSAIEDPERV